MHINEHINIIFNDISKEKLIPVAPRACPMELAIVQNFSSKCTRKYFIPPNKYEIYEQNKSKLCIKGFQSREVLWKNNCGSKFVRAFENCF